MQKISRNKYRYFPKLPRISEISNTHCGPATLKMLLANVGVKAGQQRIVNASGSSNKRLSKYGMNIHEMAVAVKNISPKVQFWFKDNVLTTELKIILKKHRCPVGVEWQGEFKQYSDEDLGHYSVVTHISKNNYSVYFADPYYHFAGKDRRIKRERFEELWWDVNEIRNQKTRKLEQIKDYHAIFVVTRKKCHFP